jgi:Zn-dependent protease with chaperone function
MNNAKVFILLGGMMALFAVVGHAPGGQGGMLVALLVAVVMNFVMYFTSSKTVLHAYKARTLSPEEASGLYATVDTLRRRAGLPMPTVAIAPHAQPNEFATGAAISGKPLALASALEKLQQSAQRIPMDVSPAVAPLAQVNPLSAFKGLSRLFSTHPSTEERVARLRAMATASR